MEKGLEEGRRRESGLQTKFSKEWMPLENNSLSLMSKGVIRLRL